MITWRSQTSQTKKCDRPSFQTGIAASSKALDRSPSNRPMLAKLGRKETVALEDYFNMTSKSYRSESRKQVSRMPLDEFKTIDSVGLRLRHLRELVGLTQLDVAERLKVGQTVISRIEKRSDLLLTTIRSYLIAIGGSLDMRAVLETGAIVQLDAIVSKMKEDPASDQQLTLPGFPAPSDVSNKDVVFS